MKLMLSKFHINGHALRLNQTQLPWKMTVE